MAAVEERLATARRKLIDLAAEMPKPTPVNLDAWTQLEALKRRRVMLQMQLLEKEMDDIEETLKAPEPAAPPAKRVKMTARKATR